MLCAHAGKFGHQLRNIGSRRCCCFARCTGDCTLSLDARQMAQKVTDATLICSLQCNMTRKRAHGNATARAALVHSLVFNSVEQLRSSSLSTAQRHPRPALAQFLICRSWAITAIVARAPIHQLSLSPSLGRAFSSLIAPWIPVNGSLALKSHLVPADDLRSPLCHTCHVLCALLAS